MPLIAVIFALLFLITPAMAQDFRAVTDRASFMQLIEGRDLTRLGIRLSVSPGGAISGSAFGYKITGNWQWRGQYFCRSMAYGNNAIPANCQQVLARGDTLRFISDKGTGERADLRLR